MPSKENFIPFHFKLFQIFWSLIFISTALGLGIRMFAIQSPNYLFSSSRSIALNLITLFYTWELIKLKKWGWFLATADTLLGILVISYSHVFKPQPYFILFLCIEIFVLLLLLFYRKYYK